MDRFDLHQSRALTNMPLPFWAKPYMSTILVVLGGYIQEVETEAWNVAQAYLLDSATDQQLEWLGDFVGQPNYGFTDDEYRVLVKARIRINLSNGRRHDILEVVDYFTAAKPQLEQIAIATLQLTTPASSDIHKTTFRIAMQDAKGHGVAMQWAWNDGTDGMYWAGTGEAATDTNSWAGTGETEPTLFGVEVI